MSSCTRCGQDIDPNVMEKRQSRGSDNTWCADCSGRMNRKAPKFNGIRCKSWNGEIDLDTLQPIDDKGQIVILGLRKCGNQDCIELRHIKLMSELTAEQFNRFDRTKKQRSYLKLLADLMKEQNA